MSDERRKADLRSRRYAGLGACLGERRVGRIRRSVQVAKVSEHRGKLCEEGGFCRPFGAVALITRIPGAHARRLLTVAPLGLKQTWGSRPQAIDGRPVGAEADLGLTPAGY